MYSKDHAITVLVEKMLKNKHIPNGVPFREAMKISIETIDEIYESMEEKKIVR